LYNFRSISKSKPGKIFDIKTFFLTNLTNVSVFGKYRP